MNITIPDSFQCSVCKEYKPTSEMTRRDMTKDRVSFTGVCKCGKVIAKIVIPLRAKEAK